MSLNAPGNFEQLLDQHSGPLKRVAATYEANIALQQELFQEIALAVWLAMSAFKGDSSLKTYMLRIAHNVSVKHVAKEVAKGTHIGFEEEALTDIEGTQIDQSYEQNQQAARLMQHVRKLPLQQRQLFALLMEGLSYKEIAEIAGISTANVGVMIMRTKEKLTEAMSNER